MTTATESTATALRADASLLSAFWTATADEGEVYEVRITDSRRGPLHFYGKVSGYFNDGGEYVKQLSRISGADAQTVFVTLNPVKPHLLARAKNRLENNAKATTTDDQIERRKRVLIDIDPMRDTGISATEDERAAALTVRDQIHDYLTELGWPDPLYASMSGNGGALVYSIDLPNDTESAVLIERCLKALDQRFSTEAVKVDTTPFNASRLTKVIGSVAAKGDHCPELGRGWSLATADFNRGAPVVSRELLDQLAALDTSAASPASAGQRRNGAIFKDVTADGERSWSVGDLLRQNNITFTEKTKTYATVYKLDRCLTSEDHDDGAALIEMNSGALDYTCHHDRCRAKGWFDVRAALGLGERINGTNGSQPAGSRHEGAPAQESAAADAAPAPFPVEVLPETFRVFVEEGAKALVCPPDLIAVPLLVSAGAAIGNTRELEIKPGWREGANLYAAIVTPPGGKKSPALKLALGALYALQKTKAKLYEDLHAEYKLRLAEWERTPKGNRGPRPEEPKFPHHVTTDATTEALAPMLHRSKGILFAQDELVGWVKSMDMYRSGKGADRQRYLSMWSRTLIKVDRKTGGPPIIVPLPFLSVVGGIQDDLLSDLADSAQREDGFLDRLLWAYPEPVPDRWTTDGVQAETVEQVERIFETLDEMTGRTLRGLTVRHDEDEQAPQTEPIALRLDTEAAALWHAWYDSHSAEMAAPDFALRLRGPWAKMPSQLARLALILHCLRDPDDLRVSRQTLGAAADLVDYFKAHARRIYQHIGRQQRSLTLRILEALKQQGELSQSDLLHKVLKRNVSASSLRAALEELEETGLVKRRTPEVTTGRPPTLWSLT